MPAVDLLKSREFIHNVQESQKMHHRITPKNEPEAYTTVNNWGSTNNQSQQNLSGVSYESRRKSEQEEDINDVEIREQNINAHH